MDGDTLMFEQLTLFDEVSYKKGDTKKCFKCEEELPVSLFGTLWKRIDGSTRMGNVCRPCKKKQQDIANNLKQSNPPPTSEDYVCPICSKNEKTLESRLDSDHRRGRLIWVLDHDHKTGKFRGWLCNTCNSALGWFDDDPIKLRRALAYLIDNK